MYWDPPVVTEATTVLSVASKKYKTGDVWLAVIFVDKVIVFPVTLVTVVFVGIPDKEEMIFWPLTILVASSRTIWFVPLLYDTVDLVATKPIVIVNWAQYQ